MRQMNGVGKALSNFLCTMDAYDITDTLHR